MKSDKMFLTKEEFDAQQKFYEDIENKLPVVNLEILKSCFVKSPENTINFSDFLHIYSKTGKLIYNPEELEEE